MPNPLFSIVILGYKTVKYLETCINSIKQQTCGNFEAIIVVEECSDGSLELAQKLSATDSRFCVFSKPCSGSASAPRNFAMGIAKGDYMLFVDGDDWIEKDSLERFEQEIKRIGGADVIMGAIQEYYEQPDGSLTKSSRFANLGKNDEGRIFTGEEAIVKIGLAKCYQCLSAYRREHLLEHQLYQLVGCQQEDSEWVPKVWYYAKRICAMDYAFYNYRRHAGSVQSSCSPKILNDVAKIIDSQFEFEKANPLSPAVRRVWHNMWLSHIYWYFFHPQYQDKFTHDDRLKALRVFAGGDKAKTYAYVAKDGSLPKRLSTPFVLFAAKHGIFWPANAYFKYLYYPLIKLKG